MPVTKQQAEMIAELMIACRPHGANRWDAPGCLKAIGQVRDRALPEVIRAATRLAENREARTPMALGGNGPQWREADEVKRQVLEPFDPAETCGTCGRTKSRCVANPHADHTFERADSVTARRLDPESAAGIVAELRDRIATSQPGEVAPKPRNRGGTDPTPEYQATRTPGSATAGPSSSQEDRDE